MISYSQFDSVKTPSLLKHTTIKPPSQKQLETMDCAI